MLRYATDPVFEIFYTGVLCGKNEKYDWGNGRLILKKKYREFKCDLKKAAQDSLLMAGKNSTDTLVGYRSFDISIGIYGRRFDTDAVISGVVDALEGVIYENDRTMRHVCGTKHPLPHPQWGRGVLIQIYTKEDA